MQRTRRDASLAYAGIAGRGRRSASLPQPDFRIAVSISPFQQRSLQLASGLQADIIGQGLRLRPIFSRRGYKGVDC
jgi:hypothetical protein